MWDSKFYREAEELSRILDELSRKHNSIFIGTKRHEIVTWMDAIDSIDYYQRHNIRVTVGFEQSAIDASREIAALTEIIDRVSSRYSRGEPHNFDIESYNEHVWYPIRIYRMALDRLDYFLYRTFVRVLANIVTYFGRDK